MFTIFHSYFRTRGTNQLALQESGQFWSCVLLLLEVFGYNWRRGSWLNEVREDKTCLRARKAYSFAPFCCTLSSEPTTCGRHFTLLRNTVVPTYSLFKCLRFYQTCKKKLYYTHVSIRHFIFILTCEIEVIKNAFPKSFVNI